MPSVDRRQSILDTALRLLSSRGFGALTQTAVAEAAGIRQGLLTYYFPTRAALLRGIAEHAAQRVARDTAPRAGVPAVDLAAIRARLVEETRDDGMPRLMLSLIQMADEDAELGRWVASFQLGLFAHFEQALAAAGHPVPRAQLERLHATLVGLRIRRLMRLPGDDDDRLMALAGAAFDEAVASADADAPRNARTPAPRVRTPRR